MSASTVAPAISISAAGQERVFRDEAGQEREPGEAGVPAGEQDGSGPGLEHEEHELSGGAVTEDGPRLLGEHGGEAGRVRDRVGDVREPGDPGDQDSHDRALGGQDLPRVPPFRRAQRADGVGHRLDPGQRGPAVGERLRHDVNGADGDQPRVRAEPDRACRGHDGPQAAGQLADHAGDDHHEH
jgi:hypothetical protein